MKSTIILISLTISLSSSIETTTTKPSSEVTEKLLLKIQTEVYQNFSKDCTNLDFIYDYQNNFIFVPHMQNPLSFHDVQITRTNVILDVSLILFDNPNNSSLANGKEMTNNLTNPSKMYENKLHFASKFHFPCSLILVQTKLPPPSPVKMEDEEEEEETEENTPKFRPHVHFPGSPSYVFYLLTIVNEMELTKGGENSESLTILNEFVKSSVVIRKMQRLLIVTSSSSTLQDSISFIRRSPQKFGTVVKIPFTKMTKNLIDLYSVSKSVDYERRSLISKVCIICAESLTMFKETGVWMDYNVAIAYALASYFNATLEVESDFAPPGTGQDDEGRWDASMTQVLEGSVNLHTILRPNNLNIKYVHMTKALSQLLVTFVTDRPRKGRFGPIHVLKHPLSQQVWTAIYISIFSIFLILELIIHWNCKERRIQTFSQNFQIQFGGQKLKQPHHQHSDTLLALLQPVVDQTGLVSANVRRSLEGPLSRFTIGLWFISLIVLNCCYKSKLFESIVSPKTIPPPYKFVELAMSDYAIGALFFSASIANDFQAISSNRPMAREVLKRTTEYDYTTGECYQSIFEGRKACMGYQAVLESIGLTYMTDVYGRKIYSMATEFYFPISLCMGVSPLNPELIEPLHFIISMAEMTGLRDYWYGNSVQLNVNKGRKNAREWVMGDKPKKIYRGEGMDDTDEASDVLYLLTQLIVLSEGSAVGIFILELLWIWTRKNSMETPVQVFQMID